MTMATQMVTLDACDQHRFCTVIYVGNEALRVAMHLERETVVLLANAMLEEIGRHTRTSDGWCVECSTDAGPVYHPPRG